MLAAARLYTEQIDRLAAPIHIYINEFTFNYHLQKPVLWNAVCFYKRVITGFVNTSNHRVAANGPTLFW